MGCGGRAGWFYYTAFTWIKRVWSKKTKNVWGYVWKLKFKYTRTRWRNNVHKLCEHKAFGGKFYWAKIRSSLFLFCILPFKILHSLLFMILHSYGKNAAVAGRVEFHAFNVDVARLFEWPPRYVTLDIRPLLVDNEVGEFRTSRLDYLLWPS